MMKQRFHPLGVATTLVAALALTLGGTARAQQPPKDTVALKVVVNTKIDAAGSYVIPYDPPLEFDKLVGKADGTPIGPCDSIEHDYYQVGVDGSPLWTDAVGAWTAANGDAIFFSYKGLGDPPKTTFIITGGKGRFKGASGSGVMTYAMTGADTAVCTFVGFISAPKP
jgi:hypothetical protein